METEERPDQATVDKIKALYPDRDVVRIVMADPSGDFPFLLTSPKREEWKKYRQEMVKAGSDIEQVEAAIERAALAQIRWPDRQEVQALFDRKPGMVQNFAEEIAKLAGVHAESRVKKL